MYSYPYSMTIHQMRKMSDKRLLTMFKCARSYSLGGLKDDCYKQEEMDKLIELYKQELATRDHVPKKTKKS